MKKLFTGCALVLLAGSALAQTPTYPSKPIRWIVPYTPGGFTDNVTRLVTARLQTLLGQTIVIENKPGANSIIGADMVAKANPDGYTILTVITAHAANATLYEGRLPFDHYKSLAPISLVAISPLILTVSKDFPAKNVSELIAYARANPGKVSFGSSGVGSAAHLTSELLAHTAGIQMVHIPYKGTAPALADLMANNIQMLVDVPSSMMPHVNSGKVNGIGMFAKDRLPVAKDVPTLPQSGGPAIVSSSWVMFLAPGDTPPEIINKLSQAVNEVVQTPELKTRFADLGIIAIGSTPAETKTFLKDEINKWGQVIKTANVKAE
ncbi:MAG: tripartite tricarboxylate transporter substrate binding protein [Sheuella sp.]|nr:tripartite tricarboxylate transporter substrate binding protein [Sheuella sp.]